MARCSRSPEPADPRGLRTSRLGCKVENLECSVEHHHDLSGARDAWPGQDPTWMVCVRPARREGERAVRRSPAEVAAGGQQVEPDIC
jgi:hypothetical protein